MNDNVSGCDRFPDSFSGYIAKKTERVDILEVVLTSLLEFYYRFIITVRSSKLSSLFGNESSDYYSIIIKHFEAYLTVLHNC
jgi:hypothetical protein